MLWNPLRKDMIALTTTMPHQERHQAPRICPIDARRIAVVTYAGVYIMQFHYSTVHTHRSDRSIPDRNIPEHVFRILPACAVLPISPTDVLAVTIAPTKGKVNPRPALCRMTLNNQNVLWRQEYVSVVCVRVHVQVRMRVRISHAQRFPTDVLAIYHPFSPVDHIVSEMRAQRRTWRIYFDLLPNDTFQARAYTHTHMCARNTHARTHTHNTL